MARDITSGLNTEFTNSDLKPIFLFKSVWDSGTTRLWTGYGDLVWDGQTWSGVGHFVGFSPVHETAEIRAEGLSFTLTGVPSTLISLVLADARQGNEVSMWIGALDGSNAVVADPYKVFSGLMDVPSIEETGDTSVITLTAENRLIELEKPKIVRYTDQYQQSRFSGDLGLRYVSSIQNKAINWGKEDVVG